MRTPRGTALDAAVRMALRRARWDGPTPLEHGGLSVVVDAGELVEDVISEWWSMARPICVNAEEQAP